MRKVWGTRYKATRGPLDGVYGYKSRIWYLGDTLVRRKSVPMAWVHPNAQKYHDWGNMDSTTSNTALSILCHHFGEPAEHESQFGHRRWRRGDKKPDAMQYLSPYLYWRFKRDVLSKFPKAGFEITSDEIASWIAKQAIRRRTAAEAMAELDIKAIHENMIKNKKEWGKDGPPSLEEAREVALRLLKEAEACPDEYTTNCETCGFQMFKPLFGDIEIEFDFDSERSKGMLKFIELLGKAGAFGGD